MLFTKSDYIIMIGSIVLLCIVLGVIISNNPRLVETAIEKSSAETKYNPTFFEIYEKSVDGVCNRLIIVKPFMWHIWAISGYVYLLNESNKSCPLNYTPAILTPSNKSESLSNQVFKDVCINKVYNDIVNSYITKIQPAIIKFEIEDLQQDLNKFTILDALNFLFTEYITMDKVEDPMKEIVRTNNHIDLNRIHCTADLTAKYSSTKLDTLSKHKLQAIIQKKKLREKLN
ncbi:PIF-4 [Carcinus maenas nudivirus]|uniref:PIF-4 n=1 Tax=Carcinus maenas nudivirus TaxID=2880837 RepID=A0AAE8Y594_9VIRU|nr:PIF-4 [Carcinus maenas nudivirus]UBZ25675.1 PIF-4 [Carcinus maenas nudivirus]